MFVKNWIYRSPTQRMQLPVYCLFPVFNDPNTHVWADEKMATLRLEVSRIRASLESATFRACRSLENSMQSQMDALRESMVESHKQLASILTSSLNITPGVHPPDPYVHDDWTNEPDPVPCVSSGIVPTLDSGVPSSYCVPKTRPHPVTVFDAIDHVFLGDFPRGSGNLPLLYTHNRLRRQP